MSGVLIGVLSAVLNRILGSAHVMSVKGLPSLRMCCDRGHVSVVT